MSELVLIEKIAIDEKGILIVKPKEESFDMIYRAARGARWDNDGKYLYFVTPVKQESETIKFYNFIVMAVLEEYGKILKTDNKTIYENISEAIKIDIAKLN